MYFLRNISLTVIVIIGSYFIGNTFLGFQFYTLFFPSEAIGSGFFGFGGVGELAISIVVTYVLILPIVIFALGKQGRPLWVVIFLLPALYFITQTDLSRAWFYLLLVVIGSGIGIMLNKLLKMYSK